MYSLSNISRTFISILLSEDRVSIPNHLPVFEIYFSNIKLILTTKHPLPFSYRYRALSHSRDVKFSTPLLEHTPNSAQRRPYYKIFKPRFLARAHWSIYSDFQYEYKKSFITSRPSFLLCGQSLWTHVIRYWGLKMH